MPLVTCPLQGIAQPRPQPEGRIRRESTVLGYLVRRPEAYSLYVVYEPVRVLLQPLKTMWAVYLIQLHSLVYGYAVLLKAYHDVPHILLGHVGRSDSRCPDSAYSVYLGKPFRLILHHRNSIHAKSSYDILRSLRTNSLYKAAAKVRRQRAYGGRCKGYAAGGLELHTVRAVLVPVPCHLYSLSNDSSKHRAYCRYLVALIVNQLQHGKARVVASEYYVFDGTLYLHIAIIP